MFPIRKKYIIVALLLTATFSSVYCQSIDPKIADEYFKSNNFIQAALSYEKLVEKDPTNHEFLYKAGYSYLNCNIDKTKALPFFLKLYEIDPEEPEIQFQLGLANFYNLEFNDALNLFKEYKDKAPPERVHEVEQYMRNCYAAVELILEPEDVTFKNLGPNINTEFPDYYPFIAKDDSYIVFTSRRKGNQGGGGIEFDGYYSSDIYIASKTAGKFAKARNAGSIVNSEFDDQAVGLSDDGRKLFIYADKMKDFGDIWTSDRPTKSFQKPVKLDETVNSEQLESAASISADGNTLFFSSDRPDGLGGLDLYMTRKLPTGEWAQPQNLGSDINTPLNEDFPTLSADGETLYFCSQGHTNIGGYDVFKAKWHAETNAWYPPVNMGYPINSPQDERVISFTDDGFHAYVSSSRKDGYGDLDIYRVTFHKNLPQAIVYLTVKDEAGNVITDAMVDINDQNDDVVGSYTMNEKSKNFLMILPLDHYIIHVQAPGKKYFVQEFIIGEEEAKQGMVQKTIVLQNQ